MLVAVVFFFALIGVFVLTIFGQKLYEERNRIAQERTISSIVNLADSPEFRCANSKSNCVDGDKAIVLINKTNYLNFWPFSSLSIVKSTALYKLEEDMITCNMANYPDCDIIKIYDKKVKNEKSISSYVAFCRKDYESLDQEKGYNYDRCEIAKIVAGTEIITATSE